MKICWFGIFDSTYARNRILISGLKKNTGVTVLECNTLGLRGLKKYFSLIKKLRSLHNEYDVLFCAFPINYNVIIAKFFQNKKIVIDAFFPLYDAYVFDRKVFSARSPLALVYYCLDWINVKLADLVITDTAEHASYWKRICPKARVQVIPVGSHSEDFFPEDADDIQGKPFIVSFHGSYIPLQGVEVILRAAELLKDNRDINFRLIGPKKMIAELQPMVEQKTLRVEMIQWLPVAELNTKLNEASVVLGIFGDTPKTDRVVPNKLFQGVAVRKPVITKDTSAVRGLFTEDELCLVKNTPEALAEAILYLYQHRITGQQLASRAYRKYQTEFTEDVIGKKLHHSIGSMGI